MSSSTTQKTPAAKKKPPTDAALCKAGKAYARKQVSAMFAKSNVVDRTDKFPEFQRNELVMGKVLGHGGFGIVKEIRGFHINVPPKKPGKKTDEDVEIKEEHWKEFIAEHCLRNGGDARYACKYLKPEILKDPANFILAIKDMAIESRFLSDIKHPHIVKMRAVATVSPYDEDYFIVMDRLYDTLEQRIEKWQKRNKMCLGVMGKLADKKGVKAQILLEERVVAAFDLSSAFEYLHGRNIIYRDIKDENVAFDVRGDIKVFDFGLAKELHEDEKRADGTYRLTTPTGSTRYMAPEVSRGELYNLSCDSYSFAILFWQMLALEQPFVSYLPHMVREQVHNGSKRPKIHSEWDACIQDLLQKNWSATWTDRYTMKQTTDILRKYILHMQGGRHDAALDLARRRSTFVFHAGSRKSSSMELEFYDNSASGKGSKNSEERGA